MKFRPSNDKEWHLLYRRVIYWSIFAFLVWIFFYDGDIGDKATVIQAVVAVSLVWATFQSIDRSDKQVEVAQIALKATEEQLSLAKRQLEDILKDKEMRDMPKIVLNPQFVSSKGCFCEIVNLSHGTIYIDRVRMLMYPAEGSHFSRARNTDKNALLPGDVAIIKLMDKDVLENMNNEFQEYIDNGIEMLEKVNEVNSFDGKFLVLDYYYSSKPNEKLRSLYEIIVEFRPSLMGKRKWRLLIAATDLKLEDIF